MKKLFAAIRRAAPAVALDLCGLAGAATLTYGAALVYLPAGYIVCGAIMSGGAWLIARKG